MPDYPINKLSSVAERFFRSSKKDRFNLMLNRIYDAREMTVEKIHDFFDAFVLEGIETNALNAPDPTSTIPNLTTPNIVVDNETGEEFVEISVRCIGPFSPQQSIENPLLYISTDMETALFYKELHPKALMPISMFMQSPVNFRTNVKVQIKNGVYYIVNVAQTIQELQTLISSGLGGFNFANADFFGTGGGFSPQGGIIIPSTPLNQKKVPGTVFPCKPERQVTSPLGIRGRPATPKDIKNGTTGNLSWHGGIDLGTPMNDPIYAIADGKVSFASAPGKPSESAGYFIIIKHKGLKRVDGTEFSCATKYMHNNRNFVKTGQEVKRGQQIALAGTTGASTGPHLHFEVRDINTKGLYYEPLWLFDWYANGIKPRSHHQEKFLERTKSVAANGGHLPRPKGV